MSSPMPQRRVRVQRIAETAVQRARLSVVPRLSSGAPRMPFVTLVSLILVAGVVGLLMFNTTMQQNSFTSSSLEEKAADLTSRQQQLRMELEVLRDPQRVAEQARQLGMVPATAPAFLRMGNGKVVGEQPVPATREGRFDIRPTTHAKPKLLNPKPKVVLKQHRKKQRERAGRASTEPGATAGRNDGAGRSERPGRTEGNRSRR